MFANEKYENDLKFCDPGLVNTLTDDEQSHSHRSDTFCLSLLCGLQSSPSQHEYNQSISLRPLHVL